MNVRHLRRRNPGVSGETAAEHIRNAQTMIQFAPQYITEAKVAGYVGWYALERADLTAILNRLDLALHDLERWRGNPERVYMPLPSDGHAGSIKHNPALAVLGANPRPVTSLKARWAVLKYIRPDDPDDKNGEGVIRVHEFPQGFIATGLDDGSVHLWHPRRRLWVEQ